MTLPDGEPTDATHPTALRRPEQPQTTAWAVVETFLSQLAEGEPGVSVRQATAELLSRLRIANLITGDTLLRRVAAADRAAWVLGRMPDHGEQANQAGRAAFAEWRRQVPDEGYAALAQRMSDGEYTRLIEADGAGRQRMWDGVTRAVPGSHHAHLGPLDEEELPSAAARLHRAAERDGAELPEHEPWCNIPDHAPGRCLRRVAPDSATTTLLAPPPPEAGSSS